MRYIAPILLVILLVACPKPDEKLAPAICDDGYYPCGPDSQECCLDTTSHEFTWIIDSLGLYGSELFDAAVISQNDIWVVGIIYLPEIIPPDTVWDGWEQEGYNAAHWDGTEWSFYEVYDLAVIDGVFALGHNDIWFATGCTVVHYDGQSFERLWYCDYEQFGFNQTTTVWGTSTTNMYFAGDRGTIVHYDGNEFNRIDTGIDTDFIDITGTPDGDHVFIVGNTFARHGEDVVVHLTGLSFEWERLSYPYNLNDTLYFPDTYSADVLGDIIYIPTDEGLWKYNFKIKESNFTPASEIEYGTKIFRLTSASSENDIFLGGLYMDYVHYNGETYSYDESIPALFSHLIMKGGDRRDDLVVMVGYYGSYSQAIVTRGYRN